MNRLTEYCDGEARQVQSVKVGHSDCFNKLAAYEDTGLEPEEIKRLQEVKHGKWEIMPHSSLSNRCSSCGAVYETPEAWNYCPNCGAKMDDKPDLSNVATRLREKQMKNIGCGIGEDMRFVRIDYIIIRKRHEDEYSPDIKIWGTNLELAVHEPTEVKERQGIVLSQITHEISELFCDTTLIAIHGIMTDKSGLFSQEITYDLITGEVIDCFASKPTDLYYKLKEREPNA